MTIHPSSSALATLTQAFDLLKQIGHPVEISPLSQALAKLQNPTYRIAFVGRFQVGKSTLINRAFIKDEALLSTGEGLPTTAVATELKYGASPRLEVFNWNTESDGLPSVDKLEVSAKVIDQPSADDLARETANDDPTTRTALSRKLARVTLAWPCESLRRYTLLDTPGIDDPDEVLLANTTYRLLPECDLAVLLAPAAQLSKIETDFLRQKLFDQGFTRLLVLVSHHADTQPRSAEVLTRILSTIRGQLDSIGRSQVPVQMFCYDEAAHGDMLKTLAQIEAAVISFADAQASAARVGKAVYLAQQALHQAGSQLQAQLVVIGKSAADRTEMLANARREVDAINRRYEQVADSLRLHLRCARDNYLAEISNGLRDVGQEFASGFNAVALPSGDAFDAAAQHIREAEVFLQPKVQTVFLQSSENFQRSLRNATSQFAADVSLVQHAELTPTLNLGERSYLTRTLTQIPGYVVTLGDYVLSNGPIPGGVLVSAGLRLLLGKLLKNTQVMPADLLRRWMIESAKREISAALSALQEQAFGFVADNTQRIEAQINSGFSHLLAAELKPLEQALLQPPTNDNRQQVQDQLARLEQLAQQLPATR